MDDVINDANLEEGDGNDYLFTWKPDNWPYEKLKKLIDRFEAGEAVVERWRCHSHRRVREGSRAYLYKQGSAPNGVFALGTIIGPAERRNTVQRGEAEYEAPIRFELILDPAQGQFIMTKDQILALSKEANLTNQSSGISFPARVSRKIDKIALMSGAPMGSVIQSISSTKAAATRERFIEVYERNQKIVFELKQLYGSICQVCASKPFNGIFGDIVEGHHIQFLCDGGEDSRENIVLLCPNHHAAVHEAEPAFDWEKLEFQFGGKRVPIRTNTHLKPRSSVR